MARYRVNEALVAWSVVDGEAIVVHTETTDYFSINQSGTWVWTLLAQQPRSQDELAALLAARYGRSADESASESSEFLAQLAAAHLLLRADEAAATATALHAAGAETVAGYYEPPQLVQFGHLETLILSGE
jgi:hypothetical protein